MPPEFDETFRQRLRDLFVWRRDVRRFRRDPVPAAVIDELFEIAALAPSVGLSEPWRFVIVDSAERRQRIRTIFESCNAAALADFSAARASHYARLKLAGLDEAPVHFAVFADHGTAQGYGLGRRTMPETIDYSAVMAVHTLWLAARARGLGVGWVSILDPERVGATLDAPRDWVLIGYFCLGCPEQEDAVPELENERWEHRRPARTTVLRR
jgi:5,6-dimethylbenzimidazole synthase